MASRPAKKRRLSAATRRKYRRVHSELDGCKRKIFTLYIQQKKKLSEVRTCIAEDTGVVQSIKQYKTKLKDWGFRHNLGTTDAAHILRLLNRAKAEELPEVVTWSFRSKTREDIAKYIKRQSKLNDEAHLLSQISNEDETPRYIKLAEVSTEQRPPQIPQFPLTPQPGHSSGPLAPQAGPAEVSSMRNPPPSPESSPDLSKETSGNADHGSTSSLSTFGSEISDMDLDLAPNSMAVPAGGTEGWPALQDVCGPFFSSVPTFDLPMWNICQHVDDTISEWSAEFTNAALSSTPASIEQGCGQWFDPAQFGDYTRTHQLNDRTHSASFVMNCLDWLIYVGQQDAGCQTRASYHLGSAMFLFLNMIKGDSLAKEECLSALSVMTAIFDCFGHNARLLQLLEQCDTVTQRQIGGGNPLATTTAFKKKMLQRSEEGTPIHPVDQLRQVHLEVQRAFPKNKGPALSARYNLAWAMLENALKTDRGPKTFHPARKELEGLAKECEGHFGPTRLETIMAYATLARANLYSGDAERAEEIIVSVVIPRVRQNFPENHPYMWEAKHRHAFLLIQLAKRDPALNAKRKLQQAEQLLREVVVRRQRVLGASNPKSVHSFRMLTDVLKMQGSDEADTLWQWCQNQM
ncbi:hypothetical protein EDD36DRAFT_45611 [Exophiala viscosa]|uniref:Clr5 domain-containing protein n=1 Tax=Exophiala viscosa TaxID=2486360 RepID=A0AAN6E805_9EURO|nr:hypothetical protein EDD36DRAFT_45611 [Exophiala viscosa]